MASVDDGRMADKAVDAASVHDCDACRHSGVQSDADAYCCDCQEHMCTACVTAHMGSKLSRDHNISSEAGRPAYSNSDAATRHWTYCDNHKDKLIEWFCDTHDTMLCVDCTSVSHGTCHVKRVSEIASVATSGKSLSGVMDSIDNVKNKIEETQNARQKRIDDLERFGEIQESKIRAFKTRILELVEMFEAEGIKEIKDAVDEQKNVEMKHLVTCETLLNQLDIDRVTAADVLDTTDRSAHTVAAHSILKSLKEIENVADEIEDDDNAVEIDYQPNNSLWDLVKREGKLGELKVKTTTAIRGASGLVSKSLLATVVTAVNIVHIPAERISGSAFLSDGQLVLVERANNRVILLDTRLKIKSEFILNSSPWDVSANSSSDVIVTIPSKHTLQYFNVGATIKAGRTLTTNKRCYGVTVHNDEVYVTVHNNPGDGEVQVLDRDGTIRRRIGVNPRGTGKFRCPCYVTVGPSGAIFVSDCKGEIACFNNIGNVIYNVKYGEMKRPHGLIVDDEDNILICCRNTNDVHILRSDGARHSVLLSSDNGVMEPYSVSYRRSDGTIVVTGSGTPSCIQCAIYKVSPTSLKD